jgi:hypothetical protein
MSLEQRELERIAGDFLASAHTSTAEHFGGYSEPEIGRLGCWAGVLRHKTSYGMVTLRQMVDEVTAKWETRKERPLIVPSTIQLTASVGAPRAVSLPLLGSRPPVVV